SSRSTFWIPSRRSTSSKWGRRTSGVSAAPSLSRQKASTSSGVRKLVVQFTTVPPPTARPCRTEMDRSAVARFPRSWYRRGEAVQRLEPGAPHGHARGGPALEVLVLLHRAHPRERTRRSAGEHAEQRVIEQGEQLFQLLRAGGVERREKSVRLARHVHFAGSGSRRPGAQRAGQLRRHLPRAAGEHALSHGGEHRVLRRIEEAQRLAGRA